MTIDKLETKMEKLVEQVRSLNFSFHDSGLENDADNAKNEVIALLEGFQELAAQDWETRPQEDLSDETEDED